MSLWYGWVKEVQWALQAGWYNLKLRFTLTSSDFTFYSVLF
jgi:hypothetical protein